MHLSAPEVSKGEELETHEVPRGMFLHGSHPDALILDSNNFVGFFIIKNLQGGQQTF